MVEGTFARLYIRVGKHRYVVREVVDSPQVADGRNFVADAYLVGVFEAHSLPEFLFALILKFRYHVRHVVEPAGVSTNAPVAGVTVGVDAAFFARFAEPNDLPKYLMRMTIR